MKKLKYGLALNEKIDLKTFHATHVRPSYASRTHHLPFNRRRSLRCLEGSDDPSKHGRPWCSTPSRRENGDRLGRTPSCCDTDGTDFQPDPSGVGLERAERPRSDLHHRGFTRGERARRRSPCRSRRTFLHVFPVPQLRSSLQPPRMHRLVRRPVATLQPSRPRLSPLLLQTRRNQRSCVETHKKPRRNT